MAYMTTNEPDVLVRVRLGLANAKRVRREATASVQDWARVRDILENEQSEEDTSDEQQQQK